jgi:hypothetical protein
MSLGARICYEQSLYCNGSERPNPVYHSSVDFAGRLLYVCLMVTLCLPLLYTLANGLGYSPDRPGGIHRITRFFTSNTIFGIMYLMRNRCRE